MPDLAAIDAVIARAYEAICFAPGKQPTMHQLADVFMDGGILVNANPEEPKAQTVSAFVAQFEALYHKGAILSLHETEVHHITEVFGRVAYRLSTYEARWKETDITPFATGINSFHLVKQNERWVVASMIWNDAGERYRIPNVYLP